MADLSWLGTAIGGTNSLIGGILQYFGNRETNQTNQNIANQNLGFQRENLDYQKALQQQVFQREDTAYQRTVNDMRMAGLNPVSMQGTNGAGEVISTEAQNNGYQAQNALNGVFNVINEFMNMASNASISRAQSNLINQQAENQRIKNIYEYDILSKTLQGMVYENVGKQFANERSNIAWLNDIRNLAFNEQFGISENMPDFAKMLNFATHQDSLNKNWYKSYFQNKKDYFGNGYTFYENNPSFSSLGSLLDNNANLKGALMTNKLGAALLELLGIK